MAVIRLLLAVALFVTAVHSCSQRVNYPNFFYLKGQYVYCNAATETECDLDMPHATCVSLRFGDSAYLSTGFTAITNFCKDSLAVLGQTSTGNYTVTTKGTTGLKVYTSSTFLTCAGSYVTRVSCGFSAEK